MTNKEKLVQALWVALAIGIAIFLVRGPIRRFIVQPIFEVGFYVFKVYTALPQQLVWLLLILVGFWVAIEVVVKVRAVKRPGLEPRRYYPSRVENWGRWLNLASQGELYRLKVARELGHLTLMALANREGQSLANVRRGLQNGDIHLPDATIKIINSVPEGNSINPILKYFHRYIQAGPHSSFQQEVEETVRYLESELEVQSGESSH